MIGVVFLKGLTQLVKTKKVMSPRRRKSKTVLDSVFQSLVEFRIPKPRIPDSTNKDFSESRIRIPLHGARMT